MKTDKVISIAIKLLLCALGIWVLSSVLNLISMARTFSYIKVDNGEYAVRPYRQIPLKDILTSLNITLSELDEISKNTNKPLRPLQTAVITRVSIEKKRIVENVPFRVTWSRRYNSNLRTSEVQRGVEKTITKEVEDTYKNGALFDRKVLKERILSIEHYRLALLNKDNSVEKVFNLKNANRRKMIATAYYPGDPLAWGDGTVTFLGQKMQRGIIAVDPRVIPLRTRLFVSGFGYGYAGDTGNLILGDRVDLGVNDAEEEKSWMHRPVTVYILEPSNKY